MTILLHFLIRYGAFQHVDKENVVWILFLHFLKEIFKLFDRSSVNLVDWLKTLEVGLSNKPSFCLDYVRNFIEEFLLELGSVVFMQLLIETSEGLLEGVKAPILDSARKE